MKLHANAGLSLKGRRLLVERVLVKGWSVAEVTEAVGVSERMACKWLARFRREGEQGLLDRSSAPKRSPSRIPEERVQVITALRRLQMTGAEIAECLDMALSTVSGILTKVGMGKLGRIEMEPAVRYEHCRAGELLHIDVKKLGRIHGGAGHRVTGKRGRYTGMRTDAEGKRRNMVGWEYAHIAIDDATRLVYVEVLENDPVIPTRRSERPRARNLDEKILDLYAGGMSVRDIESHLQRLYGTTALGRDTISRVTDAVLTDVQA